MKLYVILIICCAIYYVDAQYCTGDRAKGIIAKCMEEEDATGDDLEDVYLEKQAANENAKCFRACLLQECKGMDAFGNIDVLVHKEYLQLLSGGDIEKFNLIDNVLDKCAKTPKVEGKICSTAEDYYACLFKNCQNCGWNLRYVD